ncbi:MAG: geranylgeranylglycerol-phosphate geranylgeranyltransferase [Cytophagales bacterium]|nr:geranylgeranylglycerol-phosphate geranylgeranyltransferase [Cytophaga sp.]
MNKTSKAHLKTSVFAFLKLIRSLNLFIIAFTQYMCRYFIIGRGNDTLMTIAGDWRFFLLVLCTVMVAAAGYIINDYYDIKIDLINKPKRVVIGKLMNRRIAMFSHFILNTLASFLSFFLGLKVFLVIVVTTILMWLYANQLKRTPLLGNLLISFLTGMSVYMPAFLYAQSHRLLLIYAIFAFFISLLREIIKDMEDVKGDEEFGCRTLPIIWGIRRTKVVLYGISAVFLILMLFTLFASGQPLMIYFIITIAPLFVWFLLSLAKADTTHQFLRLSSLCKWMMLAGVVSMVVL